jgi:hypothetical protein
MHTGLEHTRVSIPGCVCGGASGARRGSPCTLRLVRATGCTAESSAAALLRWRARRVYAMFMRRMACPPQHSLKIAYSGPRRGSQFAASEAVRASIVSARFGVQGVARGRSVARYIAVRTGRPPALVSKEWRAAARYTAVRAGRAASVSKVWRAAARYTAVRAGRLRASVPKVWRAATRT